jgi:SAM-dependent methyltransferase
MSPSDLAALRGEPSYVWRAGQERRLQMIAEWARLENARVLDHGGGVGMYGSQFRRRYTPHVETFDIELARAQIAQAEVPHALVAAAEHLPYTTGTFDTVLSTDVLEHVQDDRQSAQEIVRVLKIGGRAVIYVPNRWYPFETHGHYWRGQYHFGNTPLINYLPDALRNRLAPHVRAYTRRGLLRLFRGEPVSVIAYWRIHAGFDNLIARLGKRGGLLRSILYRSENTIFDVVAYSHFLVIEKTG